MQDNPYGIAALWQQSDPLIMGVAVLLLVMSVTSWFIILVHSWRLWRLRRFIRDFAGFGHTQSFSGLRYKPGDDDGYNLFYYLIEKGRTAALYHQTHKNDLQDHLTLGEWLNLSLRGAVDESAERMQRGLSVLASVGATAPFIGLLGTVWGIYHALVNIGVSGQASIDKVAGPVGEALIMTALGLGVAIPAVLGYNALVRSNKSVRAKLNRFAYQLHVYLLTGTLPPQQHFVRASKLRAKTEAI